MMLFYAPGGSYNAYRVIADIKTIKMAIIQPRLYEVPLEWSYPFQSCAVGAKENQTNREAGV